MRASFCIRVKRRSHRKPAFIQALVAEDVGHFAADFLSEVLGGKQARTGFTRFDDNRFLFGFLAVLSAYVTICDHTVDNVVAARNGGLCLPVRMIVARTFRQRCHIGDFFKRQFVNRLVEIDQRSGCDAVGPEAEIDLVEIKLENFVLGVGLLDAQGKDRFLHLALIRGGTAFTLFAHEIGQEEVLCDLLRDGRSTFRTTAGPIVLDETHRRTGNAFRVDTDMGVEILVFGCDKRLLDAIRDCLDRQEHAPLSRVFGHKTTVSGMHTRHDRWLIVLQGRIIRQILRQVLQVHPDPGGNQQRKDRADSEQVAKKLHQKFHTAGSSFPVLSASSFLTRKHLLSITDADSRTNLSAFLVHQYGDAEAIASANLPF